MIPISPIAQVRFTGLASGCFGAKLSVSEPSEPMSPPDAPSPDLFGFSEVPRSCTMRTCGRSGQPGVKWSRQLDGWVVTGHAEALERAARCNVSRADEPIRRLERITLRGGPSLGITSRPWCWRMSSFTPPPRHEVLRKFTANILRTFDGGGSA